MMFEKVGISLFIWHWCIFEKILISRGMGLYGIRVRHWLVLDIREDVRSSFYREVVLRIFGWSSQKLFALVWTGFYFYCILNVRLEIIREVRDRGFICERAPYISKVNHLFRNTIAFIISRWLFTKHIFQELQLLLVRTLRTGIGTIQTFFFFFLFWIFAWRCIFLYLYWQWWEGVRSRCIQWCIR